MNKTIRSSTREVIFRVYKHCLLEYEAGNLLSEFDNVFQRTADMTGKSVSTVRRIVEEGVQNNGKFSIPEEHSKGHIKKLLDDFDLCSIRQKVYYFYTVKKQVPTLRNLLQVVREDLGFDGSREDLRKILLSLGFKHKKCQSKRSTLMERSSIAAKRETYLKVIMDNRLLPEEQRKDVVYLGESYIHQSYKLKKCWQSVNISGIKQSVSKGKRYIIIHAGGKNGFVPNALLIFSGTNKKEDYHSDINKTNFTKWVEEKLIPNLAKPCIVVMDSAPYHSVVLNDTPSSATNISDIKMWLSLNNIPYETTLKKPQLLMLVKRHKPDPVYEIDEILGAHGHKVVRLPPYHCDLNPIELIWGIAKHKIASLNVGSVSIKEAAEHAFCEISVDDWKRSCKRVMQIEKEYYERGVTLYEDIDRIVIDLQDISSDESSDSESEMKVEYLEEEFLSE